MKVTERLICTTALFACAVMCGVSTADDRGIVGVPIEEQLGGGSRIIPGPAQLDDAAFDIYVNPVHIGQAWYSSDAALMTDVALQLAEGERVLFRSRKGLTAAEAIEVAVRIASDRNDKESLTRIAEYAKRIDDKTLATTVAAAQKLGAASRDTTFQMMIDPEEVEPEIFGKMHDCLGQIRMARIAGDVRSLDLIEKQMIPGLPQPLHAGLTKCVGTARHTVEGAKPLPPELSDRLRRLALISRPVEDEKADKPTEVTGGF